MHLVTPPRSGMPESFAPDAEPFARLRLVKGQSTAELWELVGSSGHTLLTVGASGECNWVVREQGVAPIHFSLHWDGRALRIADVHGAGNLRVDGSIVTGDWRVLEGAARVEFGQAAIVVETSASRASDSGHPLDRASQPLSGPAAGDVDGFRQRRSSDSLRAPKPTLMGLASSLPPSAPAGPTSAPPSAAVVQGSAKQTLLGVGQGHLIGAYVPSSSRPVSAPSSAPPSAAPSSPPGPRSAGRSSLAHGDQRTIQGFPAVGAVRELPGHSSSSVPPGRRETQRGLVSVPPGVVPGAVAPTRVKPISDPAPTSGANLAAPGFADTLLAVETTPVAASTASVAASTVHVPGSATDSQPPLVTADRGPMAAAHLPAAKPAMVAVAPHASRRAFPWRYVLLGVLTLASYVGWLFLLDLL